jgi:glycosyltransferase involved in cell wall biosynthesis
VGSGFRPWRRGGLVAYIEDLIEEQVRRGHEVTYFFSGRQYPYLSGPRLKRWSGGPPSMLEVVNSPLHNHGRQPALELTEPRTERLFERVISEVQPDLVHVQELAGLPTSLLDIARGREIPTVFTLQDYFPLCATFRLLDADGRVCLRREVGADCVASSAADPREPGVLLEATLMHDLNRLPPLRWMNHERVNARLYPLVRSLARRAAAARNHTSGDVRSLADAFQRRRDVNVERLNRTGCLVAMSRRLAEIYTVLGVDPERIQAVELTLRHIERLRPSERPAREGGVVTFATLAGFESQSKGARLLVEAIRSLSSGPAAGRFRVLGFGHVDPAVVPDARQLPGLELRGQYSPDRLDTLLDEVDVGIIPSIWEEAYGYVGLEFLAKGIPVIANAIGGMVEYTRDGETGWLNRSCSPQELARIMSGIIEQPRQVTELSALIRAARGSIIKPFARHADEMDAIYEQSISNRGSGS